MGLWDENGVATHAFYRAVAQIGGGLACTVLGPVAVLAWGQPFGWFVGIAGVALVIWGIVDLIRAARTP